jgi:hypothetical protein
MNRIATGLLMVTAMFLGGFGIELISSWALRALGDQFGAGEVFGIAVGIAILGWGAGVGWSARAVWHVLTVTPMTPWPAVCFLRVVTDVSPSRVS